MQQHRYVIGGGSYDWFWLFTPDGKEIGPLGRTFNKISEITYFFEVLSAIYE